MYIRLINCNLASSLRVTFIEVGGSSVFFASLSPCQVLEMSAV